MPSSGRISSAKPPRATWPGMPQTVLVASSWAMTAAPVAASAFAPASPSEPMPVSTTASAEAPKTRGGVAEQDVDGRPAEIHRRRVVDAEHELVRACRGQARGGVRPARCRSARRPALRPSCASRAGTPSWPWRCSAKTVVKIGGMCCTTSVGTCRSAPLRPARTSAMARGPPVEAPMRRQRGATGARGRGAAAAGATRFGLRRRTRRGAGGRALRPSRRAPAGSRARS